MKNPLALWACFLAVLMAGQAARSETVKSVYDGDTITLQNGEHIRLACIDAPELKDNAHGKADKPAAIASRNYLRNLLSGREVTLQRVTQDRYGRTVARVFTGSLDVSQEMVAAGYATIYTRYSQPCPWAQ